MKFLIIIPTHNEENNILFTLESLARQSYQAFSCIIVNDGSTDNTQDLVEEFIEKHQNFQLKNLDVSEHEPGAKVVRTFNYGLKNVDLDGIDIICKFDSDIIFPPNYLAEVKNIYETDPRIGMVSGLVKIKKSIFEKELAFDFIDKKQQWTFENISSNNHIRGPIKSYRKDCFYDMDGLRAVLGWDNIDVMLAKKSGWKIVTIKNLWVKHLRPTAFQYRHQKAEKLGEYFYNIGLNLPLAIISAGKSAWKDKSVSAFIMMMKSFSKQKGKKRDLSRDEIKFIRKLRWSETKKNLFS